MHTNFHLFFGARPCQGRRTGLIRPANGSCRPGVELRARSRVRPREPALPIPIAAESSRWNGRVASSKRALHEFPKDSRTDDHSGGLGGNVRGTPGRRRPRRGCIPGVFRVQESDCMAGSLCVRINRRFFGMPGGAGCLPCACADKKRPATLQERGRYAGRELDAESCQIEG